MYKSNSSKGLQFLVLSNGEPLFNEKIAAATIFVLPNLIRYSRTAVCILSNKKKKVFLFSTLVW